MGKDRLSEFYGLRIWPMDPESMEGEARFKEALKAFERVMDHDTM